MFGFLAPRLPFLGILRTGIPTQYCMVSCVEEVEPRLCSIIRLSETIKSLKRRRVFFSRKHSSGGGVMLRYFKRLAFR